MEGIPRPYSRESEPIMPPPLPEPSLCFSMSGETKNLSVQPHISSICFFVHVLFCKDTNAISAIIDTKSIK